MNDPVGTSYRRTPARGGATPAIRSVRRDAFYILVILAMAGCGGPNATEDPLRPPRGIALLHWGADPDTARARMTAMEGVRLAEDTVLSWVGLSWQSPDTVEVWPFIRHFRRQRYEGGMFLGFSVVGWELSFNDAARLSDVRVDIDAGDNPQRSYRQLRVLLNSFYGDPDDETLSALSWAADGWDSPAADTASPVTRVSMAKLPQNMIGFVFIERRWRDSVASVYENNPRERLHVDEWEKRRQRIEHETGWTLTY